MIKFNLVPKKPWIIEDWTGADVFEGKSFASFDDAEEFLSDFIKDDYEDCRQEYEIKRIEFKTEKQKRWY